MKLACRLAAAAALLPAACSSARSAPPLKLRAPDLKAPLVEILPGPSRPKDPVKALVFSRINRDRMAAGLSPVGWDEAAARVADAFCAQQVREASRGHFLMDGIPPYARTGLAGIFGLQAENSVSWVTTGARFSESTTELALTGHDEMMAERPPADGHRRTILDPDATHVGVGYALERGRFQMAQEFLVRNLERLSLTARDGARIAVRVEGKPAADWRLQFVLIAREPPPAPLSREEATARVSYSYPRAELALVPEGLTRVSISGAVTQDSVRILPKGDFTFLFAPARAGLYTFVFYTGAPGRLARPGASASIWIEDTP